jgi:glycosyltransferase involved in cell wall biosynthesis
MRIVCIAPYMPYVGIPHAGGEFFRRHVELLSRDHHVTVICPRTPDNESAMGAGVSAPYRRLLAAPRFRFPLVGSRFTHRVLARLVPFLAVRSLARALLTDERCLSELRKADRIEFQWFFAVTMASYVRRTLPGKPVIGVFHDVVSQGYARTLTSPTVAPVQRLGALLQLLISIPMEQRAMRTLDIAVVLSEKDRDLLVARGGTARIVVVSPPLDDDDMPAEPRAEAPSVPDVVFVGALWRSENEDAALWLLRDIWPWVRSAVPGARLTIAGAGPSEAVLRVVADRDDVQVTGYVPSLTPYYERASVVVAPLRLGAGVKLKTIVAMLWGLPVVATSVGAEGVDGRDVFVAVVDEGRRLARALIEVLQKPAAVSDVRMRAYRWAHDTYSTEQYRRTLELIYA